MKLCLYHGSGFGCVYYSIYVTNFTDPEAAKTPLCLPVRVAHVWEEGDDFFFLVGKQFRL